MNIGNYLQARESERVQLAPENKLQRLAFMKGLRSAASFATALSRAKVVSYGTGYKKWNGLAESTQYDTLLAIAKFLGASSVEEVFDP